MKQLSNALYHNLSPEERIIASIEANARGDENEVQKLIKTCPKKHYTSTDRAYSQRMDYLFAIQVAVEADLTSYALSYAVTNVYNFDTEKSVIILEDAQQKIIDIKTAWYEFLTDKGINPETMERMAMNMRHPYLDLLLDCPYCEADRETVKIYRDIFERTYNRNIC